MRLLCSLFLFLPVLPFAQSLVDPCFQSVPAGQFYGSNDIRNICQCIESNLASDMLEWDSENGGWLGAMESSEIYKEPPFGCIQKALWIGANNWTTGGEGFALRLDKPLEVGKVYSYTFTYASAGRGGTGSFSPSVYTSGENYPKVNLNYSVGNLPATDDWATNTITFTTTEKNAGHYWLVFHTYDCSGLIISNCNLSNPIREDLIGKSDLLFCKGERVHIQATSNPNCLYHWNTGATSSSIFVTESGTYTLDITNRSCTISDSIELTFRDCETRLVMPNIFTPNGDELNDTFLPIEHNYITTTQLKIFNRWGELIFSGDLVKGWSGQNDNNQLVPTGIYFYEITYLNEESQQGHLTGIVTLAW